MNTNIVKLKINTVISATTDFASLLIDEANRRLIPDSVNYSIGRGTRPIIQQCLHQLYQITQHQKIQIYYFVFKSQKCSKLSNL